MSGTPVTIAETQEKIHRSKTKLLDGQAGYLEEKIVGSEYINIVEDDGAVGKCLKVELDASAVITGVLDGKVKVDTSDVREFLENKITAGTGISITKKTVSGKKNLEIAGAYTAGAGIVITGASIASNITQVVTESTFTGHPTRVPTSKAVADVLQLGLITDADSLASSGNALMYKTISVPVHGMGLCEYKGASNITNHYPSKIGVPDIYANNVANFFTRYPTGIKVLTVESSEPSEDDGYAMLYANVTLDEDVADYSHIFVDVVALISARGGDDSQTNIACVAIASNSLDATPTVSSRQTEKIFDAEGLGKCVDLSFDMDISAMTHTSKKPTAFTAALYVASDLLPADEGYGMLGEVTILSCRIRYATKTINLRIADVDI
jgi:hypothetical protein